MPVQEPLFDIDRPAASPQTYRELAEKARAEGCPDLAKRLEQMARIAERMPIK